MRTSPIHYLVMLLAGLLIGATVHATAGSPGTLDPFWGTGSALGPGKVMTPVGSGSDIATSIAVQPDGKVVVAGYCESGAFYAFCAVRYNADGILDPDFNGNGKVITPVGLRDAVAAAVALQPDGKLVLAGSCSNGSNKDFCAARYLANGSLDANFGTGGKVITAIGGGEEIAQAVVLQPDGKLVLAGWCRPSGSTSAFFCAQRLLANGTPDASFGNAANGAVITLSFTSSQQDFARSIVLQPDGKLVLAGYCYNGTNDDFCALRYLADGALDPSFGTGGKVITAVGGGADYASALALQPDGGLVLAGRCAAGFDARFCAVRYLGNGNLDANFGAGGKVITPVGAANRDYATAVVLQPDGKLVLAGFCLNGLDYIFCALRYHANGTHLDTTFNSIGTLGTAVGSSNTSAIDTVIALQPDGKLILAGGCFNGTNLDFCAVRYDGGPFGYKNCSLDIDGDNRVLATTDSLIAARIALGITGPAVVNGITFSANATRNTWPLIRDYLVSQCGMSLQL